MYYQMCDVLANPPTQVAEWIKGRMEIETYQGWGYDARQYTGQTSKL
jgi:serine protease inhibitor ecotin